MKRLAAGLSFVLFLLVMGGPTLAQEAGSATMGKPATAESLIYPYPEPQPTQLLGQDQHYSVTFRGNGEAVVSLRVVLSNLEERPIATVKLRIPKIAPQDVIAFQVIKERYCVGYRSPTVCERYQEPDYREIWGGGTATKYQKAATELQADTIVVTLPRPIPSNQSGSFLLYYRGPGYAMKDLVGGWHFAFETAKVEDKIQTLQVGINTDSDLYLKGAKGKVNYRFDDLGIAMKEAAGASGPMASPQVDRFYEQIGSGEIVKTATNLQPLDSYTVKGVYADARLKLYAKELIIGLVVALLIIAMLVLLVRWIMRRLSGVNPPAGERAKADATTTGVIIFGISFLTSLLLLGYTILVIFIAQSDLGLPYDTRGPLLLLLAVTSIGVYGVLLFAPGIYLTFKRGIGWGIATTGLTVFWLVIYLVGYLLFIALVGYRRPDYPIPLMERVAPASSIEGTPDSTE